MAYFRPDYAQFTFIKGNFDVGGKIAIPGDLQTYDLTPGQRFIPHTLPGDDPRHPAKIGDMVSVRDFAVPGFFKSVNGFEIGFVTAKRSFKRYKTTVPSREVELLGLPGRWFSVAQFNEYAAQRFNGALFSGWLFPWSRYVQ